MSTNEERLRNYLKRATAELREARRRLAAGEGRVEEPIAIVGMACRYPGGVASPEELWELVATGRDAITGFPSDRGWDLERIYDPDPDRPDASYARAGGFLADAARFDSDFFGISPREAQATDPQQRLLLEVGWEALERAGIDPTSLRGTATGVFAGISSQDYSGGLRAPEEGMEGYRLTGSSASVASGRLAYALGLEGPAVSVDTACSSSLVAIHLAAQALRAGECSLALAGGATVLATPGMFVEFSRQRGLAPDGRCKSFAEAADGTGFSEGAGLLALERLSDARRNGHPVWATVRGSAVNQDGASNGLTAPNGPSQERVIRAALASADLDPGEVDAVEAHGTGTTLGDPIEAGALLATYGASRPQGRPLRLGSIKSNIGHTQAAAGVAGVIKMAMAMREGALPATLHVDAPSSKVDWEAGEVELLTEQTPWEQGGRPRRAGVSSFGISGTNAHLLLEEPGEDDRPQREQTPTAPLPGQLLLPISAKSEPALREAAERLAAHLRANPGLDPVDLGASLATTRSAFEHRAVVLGGDREELLGGLGAVGRGSPSAKAITARARPGKLAFLFSGQGSQRAGMGGELYAASPVFAAAMDEACEELDRHLERPLKALLFSAPGSAEAELLDHTSYAQPALFALQVALFAALEAQGLDAQLLAGHSVGEISAAHLAGVFSLPDAARLVAARGRLMGELPAGGAMEAIGAMEEEVVEAMAGREGEISIAAVNGPASVVVSGEEEAVQAVASAFAERGRRTKRLTVSHAFHSPLIEPMMERFDEVAREISYSEPELPIVSTVSGELLEPARATDPGYWVSHARRPVRFAAAVETLAASGASAYLELGPDPVLVAMAAECLADSDPPPALIGTLRGGSPEAETLALALANAAAAGAGLDWERLFEGTGARQVPLPTYPFQGRRYWLDSAASASDLAAVGQASAEHPLLGAVIEGPGGGLTLTGRISLQTHPWLEDHVVAGVAPLPGAAFVELALRAGRQVDCELLEELTLEAPLVLAEQGATEVQVTVAGPEEGGDRGLTIHSRPDSPQGGQWTLHATGTLSPQAPEPPEPLGPWPPPGAQPVDVEGLYERLQEAGYAYGPAFQGLTAAWREGDHVYAEVGLAGEAIAEAGRFVLHPALLDAALHAALGVALEAGEGDGPPLLPFAWSGVSAHARGASRLRARIALDGEKVSLTLAEESGTAIAEVGSLLLRPLAAEQLPAASGRQEGLLEVEWGQVQSAEGAEPAAVPWRCPRHDEQPDPTRRALAATTAALEKAQEWLAAPEPPDARLAILTEGAVAALQGESPDPAAAAVWGLLRSAQSEHPGRFALIDTDASEASLAALPAALALGEEPQLALREGQALAPRLREVGGGGEEYPPQPLDPAKTVLITGATGTLGALTARHLASAHGARHLLLVSRSGEEAKGAPELAAQLSDLGAEVRVAACDVSDPAALRALLAQIPPAHPLGAVVHAAGVLQDATIGSLDPAKLRAVLDPKAAAWHLHELTAGLDLSAFVLFSSVSATLGLPGQGNYAAANAFMDALAQQRRASGLPATSIAWGLWEPRSTLTAELQEADLARLRRMGIAPLPEQHGLELFDQALGAQRDVALAASLDRPVLREQASAGSLPPIMRGLIRRPRQRPAPAASLAQQLAAMPEADREPFALGLVRAEVAAVLGHGSGDDIEAGRAFKDLGFDSLAAVELRNRLMAPTGLRLAPTVVFDYPSPASLAAHLLAEATAGAPARLAAAKRQTFDEPIAIVGMACRYPGGVASPEELWELVAAGRDAITGFPSDRGWDLERIYDPDPDRTGTSYAREGGFLHRAADFDPGFFGVTPREALATDPQQRLLLEVGWEALERAGILPATLRGREVGVFTGVMYHEYGADLWTADGAGLEGYATTGSAGSVASGRLAYALGLEGPAVSVDTACSSSLVAIHLAAQALRAGECEMALAGGVTVMPTPRTFVEFSRQRGLAPDGRCKSFAAAADGVGWSEGAGLLALERLSDARRNGHPVWATVRGSAVNQDGASNGLTAPNGPSQERVIRAALASADLDPGEVDAVEAHGTGTTLGDPIEAGALLATYGASRPQGRPLRLGSIKSNIGHTQAAAGVAGVIKMAMAMREGALPATLHVDAPSSKVDWEAGEVELLTEQTPWEQGGRPRRAGVSSFGISGTNAHLLLEEPGEDDRPQREQTPTAPLPGQLLLPISAKSEPALREAAERLAAHLRANPGLDPVDLGASLATTRSAFEHRAVVLGGDREELLGGLGALAAAGRAPGLAQGHAPEERRPVFLFAGQGSQHPRMAAELLEAAPAFARRIAECEEALSPYVEWSLAEVLRDPQGAWLERLDVVQPALFAVMVSLAGLWRELGVEPAAVLGHSQGEIAAAHLAGALSLPDAARVAALRGAAMAKLAGKGAMAAISLPLEQLSPLIEPFAGRLSLAANNGPASQAVSGDPDAIAELLEACRARDVRCREIAVDYAAHSPQIDALREELLEAFAPISPQSAEVPFHSTVTGEPLDTAGLDAEYWYRNLREPVRLEPVVRSLLHGGHRTFLEVSPHPVLAFGLRETVDATLAEEDAAVLGTLRRGEGGPERLARSLAEVHLAGGEVDWEAHYRGSGAKQVPLPTYPFQRKRFWLAPTASAQGLEAAGLASAEHPLLGAVIEGPGGGLTLTGRISLQTHPWLADHALQGSVLLPATGFLELALHAAALAGLAGVQELVMPEPLLIPESGAVEVQVSLSQGEEEVPKLTIHSRPDSPQGGQWTLHATGTLSPQAPEPPEPLGPWPPPGAQPVDVEGLYERLQEAGYAYGPAFQGLTAAWREGDHVYAEVGLAPDQARTAAGYAIHPALLDAALHATMGGDQGAERPFTWSEVRLHATGAGALRVKLRRVGEGTISLSIYDPSGTSVAEVGSLRTRPLDPGGSRPHPAAPLFALEWLEQAAPSLAGAGPKRLATLGGLDLGGLAAEAHRDLASLREAIEAGSPVPDAVVAELSPLEEDGSPVERARFAARRALALLQPWLAEERLAGIRLVLVTRGVVAAREGEAVDLAAAPLWGLLRSAQSEHPGRFVFLDVDEPASLAALPAVLESGEAQLALRGGAMCIPRLTPARAAAESRPLDPDGTVLITGGTGGLGGLAARRLVEHHGARHLLLVSRRGAAAAGATELCAELERLGARVTVAACDVAEREQVAALLSSIPQDHPLDLVVHAAGALDDGPVESIDPSQLDRVFAPKVDGAWHLHELTEGIDHSRFVMFSSIAGIFGSPGRSNYAAANTFLDALAQQRRARGLPATSIVWSLWQRESEMASNLSATERVRARRSGVEELSDEHGLALFSAALETELPAPVALRLDPAALRGRGGSLPPMLSGLARPVARRPASLAATLARLSPGEREKAILDLIYREVAEVLGPDSAKAIAEETMFVDLGFDSLGALELRERLAAATGLDLEATLIFDHPTPAALTEHLSAAARAPSPAPPG